MKKLIVLTGAGISAESGISTFRDKDGLWEKHRIEDVATPQGWHANPKLVLDFYNQRRKQLLTCKPNGAHLALAKLEQYFDVHIITQNVDDLHERAGSSQILHLHGELKKVRSSMDESLIYDLDGWQLNLGDKCEKGSQLRPHIVWFGEMVPAIEQAADIMANADLVLIIGTSLNVYPAASLMHYAPSETPIYIIDPVQPNAAKDSKITHITQKAVEGMNQLLPLLIQQK